MSEDDWIKFTELENIADINSFSDSYRKGELEFESIQHEISFLYNMGSYYSKQYDTHNPSDVVFRKDDKYYLGTYYYLKGIKLYEDNKVVLETDQDFIFEVIRRLFVNIGNEYSNQFRSIDALSYYRKALEIDDCFDMAIGNFALGIEHHNPLIGLGEDIYCMVFNLLYELYLDIHLENLDNGQELFKSKKIQYIRQQQAYFDTITKGKDANYDAYAFFNEVDYFTDSYEDWCIKNTLYLNFVNDLGNYEEAKFDINIQKLKDDLELTDERFHSLKNLFDVFILQRKKLFACRNIENDEMVHELAQVFQCLYSYFDRVAFFIYRYFKLTGKERAVNINSVWAMKDEDGNILTEYRNQHLYNIYWLRKEYRESKSDSFNINELLSPDAQDYADIRNTLEHKEFSFSEIKGLTFLNPELLYSKTLKMATVVRNMILSLIPMINIERSLIDPTTKKRNLDLVFFIFEGFK
ncbi:LA2681 family HEPN domain-containing protein [Lacrimispora sp.]|uniref:LA2681 family HEPN domain-containing protein n=1 Tax=Lacrimispora sp. TaxID=2719234 RepID=UPI0032E37F23